MLNNVVTMALLNKFILHSFDSADGPPTNPDLSFSAKIQGSGPCVRDQRATSRVES